MRDCGKMKNFFWISFFIFSLFIFASISTLFIYPERTQNFIVEKLNLKSFLNKKIKIFISRKINDRNINVEIETIKLLKPDWPNIAKIELHDVNIYSFGQKKNSKIRLIELGFSYDKLFANLLLNDNDTQISYVKFQDLKLNARIEKEQFLLGPLLKVFSLINQNNFQLNTSLRKIFESKIIIGNIDFLLINNKNIRKEKVLEIKCENVIISELIDKSRNLNMDCNKGKNNLFSLKANFFGEFNNFSGKIQNINSNLLLDHWLNENFNFLKTGFHSQLNGSYSIKTKKDFSIESFNFVSDESILTLKKIEEEKSLKTNLSGSLSWEKKTNLFRFTNLFLGEQFVASGEIDLVSQKGYTNFLSQKISVEDTKNYINELFTFYRFPLEINFSKISNKFRDGNLKNLSIIVKFSLIEEFVIEEITGSSVFNNTRFQYNDKIFKELFSTISGDFNFKVKPQEFNDNLIKINLTATDGTIFINNNIQYKFSKAIISGRFYNNNFLISKADFFKNSNVEYTFNDVVIGKENLYIARAKYIKENKVQYIFSNTIINNMYVIKSFLKIKNNEELAKYIKSKFDIELIGNIDLDIFLTGDLDNLNLDLKLNSNLKNSYLKIDYLDLIKKKNVASSIKVEISMIGGKIVFFKNTHLSIDNKTYKIGLIDFNEKDINKFLFKNLETPNMNVDKIILSKNGGKLNIQASGKKIDLSSLNKNLKNKTNLNKNISVDLTSDLIILNPKISLTGNLKGEIKGSSFNSLAYGKMSLGGSSLLDNGKFKILVDNKVSKLEGLGLIGGAETKINLEKHVNSFPTLKFDTSNGGKLLSGLGFTKNIKSGDMKIHVNFLNDDYDHYEGQIKSKKFSIINAPGIINSLSVLSFAGIGSIISGEGVFFDRGEVNINVKNKNFNFDKLYLTSESLGIAARGNLNLNQNSIHMIGSVAPIKLISKILSIVPAVGELLTGLKKEGLFAGQFNMQGLIENPEIKLNTMSFAPGILRDLFSENWFDNKNFFINNAID